MTAPKIEKLLTPYNFTNANNVGRIKYIVIHYVGARGRTATIMLPSTSEHPPTTL